MSRMLTGKQSFSKKAFGRALFKITGNADINDGNKEEIELYDILESNHIFTTVIDALPEEEYNTLVDNLFECADNLYQYRNSVYGIMEVLGKDYSNLDVDINSIQEKLGNLGDIDLLRSVMAKLG